MNDHIFRLWHKDSVGAEEFIDVSIEYCESFIQAIISRNVTPSYWSSRDELIEWTATEYSPRRLKKWLEQNGEFPPLPEAKTASDRPRILPKTALTGL